MTQVSGARPLAIVMLLGGLSGLVAHASPRPVPAHSEIRFAGVYGPRQDSAVGPARDTSSDVYGQGSRTRLAVLLTARRSNWLGLAHGLKSAGIPFVVTHDVARALRHSVVYVYPRIPGRGANADAVASYRAFVARGGTLLTDGVPAGGLADVFGVTGVSHPGIETTVTFQTSTLPGLSGRRFRDVRFNGDPGSGNVIGVYAYTLGHGAEAAARYGDGTPAIGFRQEVSGGRAYAIGIDLGYLFLRGYGDHAEGAYRDYDDHFNPVIDDFLGFLKAAYRRGEPAAVTLWTAPDNAPLSIILTHDVDYSGSFTRMGKYAALEQRFGVSATYFIQTKILKDWEDKAFFDQQAGVALRALRAQGASLGSHSVSHSPVFERFPLGTGREVYPSYRPFVWSHTLTVGGSVLGELRVSRFLIRHFVPTASVRAFRAGYLLKPVNLPEALAATGFWEDSSATADESLTHLPFQLDARRGYHEEVPVFEFPITIEDQVKPSLLADQAQLLSLVARIGHEGGICVVLIHPNVLAGKYTFETQFLTAMRGHAWIGSLGAFGRWWRARNALGVDATLDGRYATVKLTAPHALTGLTLQVPPGWHLVAGAPAHSVQQGHRVILGALAGIQTVRFQVATATPIGP